jgi:hypothetical protein
MCLIPAKKQGFDLNVLFRWLLIQGAHCDCHQLPRPPTQGEGWGEGEIMFLVPFGPICSDLARSGRTALPLAHSRSRGRAFIAFAKRVHRRPRAAAGSGAPQGG